MARNINKDTLVSAIAEKTELAKKDIELVIDTMTEEITKFIKAGDKVTLYWFWNLQNVCPRGTRRD